MRPEHWRGLALALVGLILAQPVFAADKARPAKPAPVAAGRNVSSSAWTIAGTTARLRVTVPAAAARALADRGAPAPSVVAVSKAVRAGFSVTSATGDCPPIDQGEGIGDIYTLARTPGQDRFELIFVCTAAPGMALHDRFLFDRAPGHLNYASVQVEGAPATMQVFTADHQDLSMPAAGATLRDAGSGRLFWLGLKGFLGAPDRVCLIAGLALLAVGSRGWASGALGLLLGFVLSVVLALTADLVIEPGLGAASMGLLVAAVGGAAMRPEAVSPAGRGMRFTGWTLAILIALAAVALGARQGQSTALVAAGIAVGGLAVIGAAAMRPRPFWLTAGPALILGLIDGMTRATDMASLHLPYGRTLPGLAAMDAGAVVAAAGLGAVVFGLLEIARRRFASVTVWIFELAGAALVAVGMFWFVGRIVS